MQLTIHTADKDAKVISHLLAKNPANLYERSQNGHLVRMFFSTFREDEVEVTFFVTPDPIELSRDGSEKYDITSYINDREFSVSSIFCTFLRTALGTALNGKPKEAYTGWVDHAFPFTFEFGPLASSLSDGAIRELFEPLGFAVGIDRSEGEPAARFITLKGSTTLQQGLRQLYVLIPVLDQYKHYYIDEKEIDKIERYGKGWLDDHPKRSFILQRALRFKDVYRHVLPEEGKGKSEPAKPRLNDTRYESIIHVVKDLQTKSSVVDMGSGEGKLATRLGLVPGIEEILAVEPSEQATLKALKRFEKAESQPGFLKPTTVMGSLFYYDERLRNKDVIILCEVIEHIDEHRLPKIMETILGAYRPRTLLITTPNAEYNRVYDMGEGYRHPDHRFEWTREEFQTWCREMDHEEAYDITHQGIGDAHDTHGQPTQFAIFTRKEEA
ncbi:methyltransferase domain-containing protein [Rossellomorea marisflavi]|uniref:methyltransferase domain-containing protein n=1 Tax=Rossellomorea marisflavi TaxID=189381 RepID=UPI0009A74076|nr:methyltransferase domain-containing protein [Rossellomorea marisflavi]